MRGCIRVCVCVCECVRGRERERKRETVCMRVYYVCTCVEYVYA